MEKATCYAKLIAVSKDIDDYTTYVFKLLDASDIEIFHQNYIMCIKYPNWQHGPIKLFAKGYLQVIEVLSGIDQYFNGDQLEYYKYNNVQFIKFVEEPNKELIDKTIILDLLFLNIMMNYKEQ